MSRINPLIDPQPDPFEAVRKRNEKEVNEFKEFQRLSYEMFIVSKDGQHLYDLVVKNFLNNSGVALGNFDNAGYKAVYREGFREGLLSFLRNGKEHLENIQKGDKR